MTPELQKAAHALREAAAGEAPWKEVPECFQRYWIWQARIALLSLLPPSDGMVEAAMAAWLEDSGDRMSWALYAEAYPEAADICRRGMRAALTAAHRHATSL